MVENTIVTACDQNYAIGCWLLAVSMRKAGMTEKLLIGTYDWSPEWLEDIKKIPGVETVALSTKDKRCVTCSKPEIMLRAASPIVTWADCDGFFTGNCSAYLYDDNPDVLYLRPRVPSECRELYRRERPAGDPTDTIPKNILAIWQKDVGERETPRRQYSCSTGIISVHRKLLPFIEKWRAQMLKVLPCDVGIVNRQSIAYFQTDDSVLNSLILFAEDAPEITPKYMADKKELPHYVHFGYNPKPWIMWNKHSFVHIEAVTELIEWGVAQGYAPRAKMPYTFLRKNRRLCQVLAPWGKQYSRWLKIRKKLSRLLPH